jgi:SAM-dependent methyltransferase
VKQYDRSYFDHWYRSRARVVTPHSLRRKVHLAVSSAEFVLGREIRSVLDVGCGEAPWRALLRRMRPEIKYTGVDSSEYVVRRYGAKRQIRQGSVGTLDRVGLRGPFDLIVCADVLAYVPREDLRRGLRSMSKMLRGVAYIEAYITSDDMIGDMEGWHHRTEATYRRAFADAGLKACGLNCWVTNARAEQLAAMERSGG